MKDKANILVVGTSGAGKSTLINTIVGANVAKVGSGKHVTEDMQSYVVEDLNLQLIDSRGFEYSRWNTNKSVKDMRKWMKAGLKDSKPRIHMLWFCVDATSKRFTKDTIRTMEAVKKEWKEVPIIVVLTKSFFVAEDNDNIEMVKKTFYKFAKKTGMPLAIIPVLAAAPKEENINPRGIDELIDTTIKNIDEAVRTSDEAVKKFDLKCKRIQSQTVAIAATTGAAVVGAVPIDFPDAAILTPLETGVITGIARIYGLDKKDDSVNRLTTRIIEAGAVSMIAKTMINQLKLIPGLNVAADVLNAIVAGAIVLGIGEAASLIMEKAYLGDISMENLEWVDKIVQECTGKTVAKLTDVVKSKSGKIKINDILKTLIQKEVNTPNSNIAIEEHRKR